MYLIEYYKKDYYGFEKFNNKAVAMQYYKTLKRLKYEVKPPQLIDKSVVSALYWYAMEYERQTINIYNVVFKTKNTTTYKDCLITWSGTDYSVYVLDKRGPGLMVRAAGFDSCQHKLKHNELIKLCAAWIDHNYITEVQK
tara:strand:+ start:189 stop:608 length:420 start_codon:yes stop_codon:yes gene_type:complete